MKCKKCGSEYEIVDKYQGRGGKSIYVCFCNECNRYHHIDAASKRSVSTTQYYDKKRKKPFAGALILGIIAFFALFWLSGITNYVALMNGVISALYNFGILLIMAAIIIAVIKRQAVSVVFAFTTGILLITAFLCSVFNFPYFLRHIKGSEFIIIYIIYAVVIMAAGITLNILIPKAADKVLYALIKKCRANNKEVSDVQTDGDAAYYLLKAKLKGYLQFRVDNEKNFTYITLSEGITNQDIARIATSDKKTARVLELTQGREYTLKQLIIKLENDKVINKKEVNRLKRIKAVYFNVMYTFFYIYWALIFTPGICKLFMGIQNSKSILYLSLFIMLLFIIVYLDREYFLERLHFHGKSINSYTKGLFKWYDKDLLESVTVDRQDFSDGEIEEILEAFCCCCDTLSVARTYKLRYRFMQALVIHTKLINRKNPLDWTKFKVFNDLYLILKKLGFESDPGSYGSYSACSSCSSCSSCGGCGGGCGGCGGGCGGCGD